MKMLITWYVATNPLWELDLRLTYSLPQETQVTTYQVLNDPLRGTCTTPTG